jgi:hypothetical protein
MVDYFKSQQMRRVVCHNIQHEIIGECHNLNFELATKARAWKVRAESATW